MANKVLNSLLFILLWLACKIIELIERLQNENF